ncbi:MAG TPA: NHL repeat-containing protein [Phycisphaerales bacterium]|nr:NHL repeat-containing protein [Phycisphaerales bacterium]
MLRSCIDRLAMLAIVMAGIVPPAAAQSQPDVQPFAFGAFEGVIRDLSLPSGAAIAADGSIFVVDAGDHSVHAFTRDGATIRTFGTLGEGEGQLHSPAAIAMGDDGLLYVADSCNDRLQVFTGAGKLVRGWGGRGAAHGEFCNPQGIAAFGDRIYVADTGNQRVQVFRNDGTFLLAIGEAPAALTMPGATVDRDGRFRRPVDVAVDDAGRICVVDIDANRVQIFDSSGGLVRGFGDYGPFAGLLNEPQGIACYAGQILIADTSNHRVQFFDDKGEMKKQWGIHDPVSHEGNGRIHYPHDVTIARDGSLAVLCEPLEHRVQIFRGWKPGEAQEPRQANLAGDQTHFGSRLSIDGRLMLIPEPEHQYIYVLDLQKEVPTMISQSGTRGTKFGQFIRPTGLLVNEREKTVIVADPSLARIQTFSLAFKPEAPLNFDPYFSRFVRSIDCSHPRFAKPAEGMRWPLRPETVKRDGQGNLHVLDQRNAMVVVFDQQMRFLRGYGGFGSGPGQLRQPTDLAFSPDGLIAYVADAGNFRVLAFDSRGDVVRTIGSYGNGDGQFRLPFGLAVDSTGAVFVSDALGDCIQKFDAAGAFMAKWGSRGLEYGKFWRPQGMAIDQRQRLIVIDHGNHRAQMFSLAGEWLGTFGAGRAVLKSQLPE